MAAKRKSAGRSLSALVAGTRQNRSPKPFQPVTRKNSAAGMKR